jgi:hypothetical protein
VGQHIRGMGAAGMNLGAYDHIDRLAGTVGRDDGDVGAGPFRECLQCQVNRAVGG